MFEKFPWPGLLLAIATCVFLWIYGLPLVLVAATLLVWAGSLWLSSHKAPELDRRQDGSPFNRQNIEELFQLSGSPLLLTDRQKIVVANAVALRVLGSHIIGQDVRVAFRNPEAVKLLTADTDEGAMIRGLVRRKDIWRMGRKRIDDRLAVIELLDRTAEADISRAHTDFVANASHELRTPLASILGYVETLQESDDRLDDAVPQKFLDRIHTEGQRLQSLVSDLMSLSRIEAEKHEQPQDNVDLSSLVKRAAIDAAGPDRHARLDFDVNPFIAVRGEEHQLAQLVRNLVDNALKYGSSDQQVTVLLHPEQLGQVALKVIDRGEGIAAKHLPYLTRRFYRTEPSRSRASGGTGLGLAIVKHIVERHRGRLDIHSTLGEGTTVTVRLPLVPATPSAGS